MEARAFHFHGCVLAVFRQKAFAAKMRARIKIMRRIYAMGSGSSRSLEKQSAGVGTRISRANSSFAPTLGRTAGVDTGTGPGKFCDARPYEVLGLRRNADAAAIKSAFRKACQEAASRRQQERPKRRSGLPRSIQPTDLGEDDKRKAFDRGESTPRASRGFRGFEGFRQRGGGRPVRRSRYRLRAVFHSGRGRQAFGVDGPAAWPIFEDVLAEQRIRRPGRRAPRPRPRQCLDQFGAQEFAEPAGRDVAVAVTISLAEAALGGTRRVHRRPARRLTFNDPGRVGRGQAEISSQRSGVPGPGGHRRTAPDNHQIAPHRSQLDGANLPVRRAGSRCMRRARAPRCGCRPFDGAV